MLAGPTRIRLLRELHRSPGLNVSQLGKAVGILRSDASQELRRIQSRGFLQSERQGVSLVYRMEPDPQVASAAPLLGAICEILSTRPAYRDRETCSIAAGLAHDRRIRIVRALVGGPVPLDLLASQFHGSRTAFLHHLGQLEKHGWIRSQSNKAMLAVQDNPLARALVKLL